MENNNNTAETAEAQRARLAALRAMPHREIMAMTPAALAEWRAECRELATAIYTWQQAGCPVSAYAAQTQERRDAQDRAEAAEASAAAMAARRFWAAGPTIVEDARVHEEI